MYVNVAAREGGGITLNPTTGGQKKKGKATLGTIVREKKGALENFQEFCVWKGGRGTKTVVRKGWVTMTLPQSIDPLIG